LSELIYSLNTGQYYCNLKFNIPLWEVRVYDMSACCASPEVLAHSFRTHMESYHQYFYGFIQVLDSSVTDIKFLW